MPEAGLQIKLLVFVCETLCAGLGDFSKSPIGGDGGWLHFFNLTWGKILFFTVFSFLFFY